jgi:hypothetical protein
VPSALTTFRTTVETAWEATSPPSSAVTGDESGVAYRFTESLDDERAPGRHRELTWGRVVSRRYVMEPTGGAGTGQAESTLEAFLALERDPLNVTRTERQFVDAIDHEVEALMHAFATIGSLGTGILEAHLDEMVDDSASVQAPKSRAGNPRASTQGISRTRILFRVLHGV